MITQTGPSFTSGVAFIVFWLVVLVLGFCLWLIVKGPDVK